MKDRSLERDDMIGKHKRAFLYQGTPDYTRIVQDEVSGENIKRLPDIRDDVGQVLLLSMTLSRLDS